MSEFDWKVHSAADEFAWLEDIFSETACKWADDQTLRTEHALSQSNAEQDTKTLFAAYDRPDRIEVISRRGRYVYNFFRSEAHVRGLWRRSSLQSFEHQAEDWEILIDLDRLAEFEGEDWTWSGAITLAPNHEKAMISLSRGGSSASVFREFCLQATEFVSHGFVIDEAQTEVAWIDTDTLLVASSLHHGKTDSNYARSVCIWRRGDRLREAHVLFEIPDNHMLCSASYIRSLAKLIIRDWVSFFDKNYWIGDLDGSLRQLVIPDNLWVGWNERSLAVQLKANWHVGTSSFSGGDVIVCDIDHILDSQPPFTLLFRPESHMVLQECFWAGSVLVISVLDDLKPIFYRCSQESSWTVSRIAHLPDMGTVSLWTLDEYEEDSDGTVLCLSQTPIAPPRLSCFQVHNDSFPIVLRTAPSVFNSNGAVVTRHWAEGEDGIKIPYTQVGPRDITGDAPVHLSGYGGFRVNFLPIYDAALGKLWVEQGGTTVLAHIRGGGEFGTDWHEAGRGAFKSRSHDDFAAVAKDLVRRGVTRPSRIAVEGASNGGLLVANILTRYPECVGGIFAVMPLTDMYSYHKWLAGASWIDEYGDPEDEIDRQNIQQISAYHHIVRDKKYPPILLSCSRRDDIVHPAHARKMVAKLQHYGHQAYLYETESGGHRYGKGKFEKARLESLGINFLKKCIDWY